MTFDYICKHKFGRIWENYTKQYNAAIGFQFKNVNENLQKISRKIIITQLHTACTMCMLLICTMLMAFCRIVIVQTKYT